MELILTFKGFIAFYASGILMSYWKLYIPAMGLLRAVNPASVVLNYRWVTVIVWGLGAMLTLPFLIPAILVDSIGEKFIIAYVRQLDKKETE